MEWGINQSYSWCLFVSEHSVISCAIIVTGFVRIPRLDSVLKSSNILVVKTSNDKLRQVFMPIPGISTVYNANKISMLKTLG